MLLICVATFAVYQHGLGGQFTNWDDNWLITENRHIRGISWQNIQTMFNPLVPREELGNEYLPVRDLSYAVNYALDGLNARGYQATNLLLHLFNSLLVMLLAMRLTGRRLAGGLAGLLLAIHPVHVEAVSWLSSRKDLLATFFLLAATLLYIAARRPREARMPSQSFARRVGRDSRLAYAFSLLMFVLALLSKMPAVVLPALLVLIELFFLRGPTEPGPATDQARPDGRGSLRKLALTLPFWAVATLFTALAMKIGTGLMREPYGDGRVQSTLTALSAIARDFQLLFIGWPTHAAVDMPVQTGASLGVLTGAVILLALLGMGVTGWLAARREGPWAALAAIAGFGALWFLVALSPVSNFGIQIGTVFAERYLYIPSIGVALALAAAAAIALEKLRSPACYVPIVVLLLTCSAWTWLTVQAVKPWRSSTTLWAHALAHDPENHIAWFNAGREKQEQALQEGDETRRIALFEGAMHDYELALLFPARTYRYDAARVRVAMASVCLQRERPSYAMKLLLAAAQDIEQPWRSRALTAHADRVADIEAIIANYRGLTLSALGDHAGAVAAFEEAATKSARYVSARINLAAELSRAAIAAAPIDEEMLARAGRELAGYEQSRGRDEASIEQRARMVYAEFSRRLELSGKAGEKTVPAEFAALLESARALYAELVTLRARGGTSRRARARTLVEAAEVMARGREGDATAEVYFRNALELDPQFEGLRTLLARFLFEKTRDRGPATLEANRLLAEELRHYPTHKPALQLQAAGLRQAAVDRAHALRQRWLPAYRDVRKDDNPTWQALITAFYRGDDSLAGREEFTRGLLEVVALLRQAVESDPENSEGLGLIDGTGLPMALGMWFTRTPNLRGNAEDLLRTAFNARPEDGPLAAVLAQFYLELAEEVVNPRVRPESDQQREEQREGLNELLANMLTLSEKARNLLSGKLFRVARDIEDGVRPVTDATGKVVELSDMTRGMIVSEFMRAATLLNTENIQALDWLKHYYEKEGNLDEAVKTFQQLIKALKGNPRHLHGVRLTLAQLQTHLGEQAFRAFQNKIALDQDEEAKEMHAKSVRAYLESLETTEAILEDPEDPDKISMPLRLRGISAQRLATLLIRDAEKYLTIALEAYLRLPADFPTEIYEVRRRRATHIRDPHRKLEQLRETLRSAPPGTDTSRVRDDIRDFERHMARREAETLRIQGKFAQALERLKAAMETPSPGLYAARGEIYVAMAAAAKGAERNELVRKAVADFVNATTEPAAQLHAAELYWQDEALALKPGRIAAARAARVRAESLVETALDGIVPGDRMYDEMKDLQKRAGVLREQMEKLGSGRWRAARGFLREGRLKEALVQAEDAVEMLGDATGPWHTLARIRREIGRERREANDPEATRWFEDARAAFQTTLTLNIPLVSMRLEIQLELAELLALDLGESAAARRMIDLAREALKHAPEEVRAGLEGVWSPKLAELESRIPPR